MAKQHPTETPEYWENLASSERSFAAEDRRRRYGSVESIRIHLANAKQYEAKALELRNEPAHRRVPLLRLALLRPGGARIPLGRRVHRRRGAVPMTASIRAIHPCPDCGGTLLIQDVLVPVDVHPGYWNRRSSLLRRVREAVYAACSGCEFAIELDVRRRVAHNV